MNARIEALLYVESKTDKEYDKYDESDCLMADSFEDGYNAGAKNVFAKVLDWLEKNYDNINDMNMDKEILMLCLQRDIEEVS